MFYVQILVNGILLGGLYGLMALGMALVWGVLNIVNLAHGSFIMLGGYVVYYLFTAVLIDPFLALPFGMLAMFIFGFLVQRNIVNLIVRSALLNTLLITFGLDVIITYLAQLFFSADFRTINPSYAGSNVTLGGLVIPLVRLGGLSHRLFFGRRALVALKFHAAWSRHSCHSSESRGSSALRCKSAYDLSYYIRHWGRARRGGRGALRHGGTTHTLHRC